MAEQISSYRLEGEIAHGGMGVVYRAVHTIFDEAVAIKAIFPELTVNPELRERFIREAKIQRRLQHPNIVQIREFLIDQGRYYIVMEFVEGESLAGRMKRLKRQGEAMPLGEALGIFRQALAGLGYAHSKGVIHRDIKPANIMLTLEGTAKVTDFGIARVIGGETLTLVGTTLGTPTHMSPEQIKGIKLDHRTDIYSLGITLYETLAGRVPFERAKDSDSDYSVTEAHIHQAPEPPSRFAPTIPPFVEVAIMKALAKRPEERFASCEEFAAALEPPDLPPTKVVVVEPPPVTVIPEPPVPRRMPAPPEPVVPDRLPTITRSGRSSLRS
jgi:serine/threonine-protein kinase